MKEEWKWLIVTEHDIINGHPDSCTHCPIALAMCREIGKDEELKDYRAHVGSDDMFLEHRTDDELPISIEVFDEHQHIYMDFISEFDMTENRPDAPKPNTIGFKYRIIRRENEQR